MRQLKTAKALTPDQKAETAAVLRWLARQPVPPGLNEAEVAARWRYVVAVARQHQGHGLGLMELVMVGWQAGGAGEGLWSWRVRAGVFVATTIAS